MKSEPPIAREPSPRGHASVRRALERAESGDTEAARNALAAVLPERSVSTAAALVAAAIGDMDHALAFVEDAIAAGGGHRVAALGALFANQIGWDLDAKRVLELAAARAPDDVTTARALVAQYARHDAVDGAIRWAERCVRLRPSDRDILSALTSLHAQRGDRADVCRYAPCVADPPCDAARLVDVGRWLRSVGEFDAAEARFMEARLLEPANVAAAVALAELDAWSGAFDAAEARLEGSPPDLASVSRIHGIVALSRGQRARARDRFSSASTEDAEAHVWLAELDIEDGRLEDAHEHLTAATERAHRASFAAFVMRLRINVEERRGQHFPFQHAVDHLLPALEAVTGTRSPPVGGLSHDAWRSYLESATRRMTGNRSVLPTYRDGPRTRLVPRVRDPRLESRRVLNRVRVDDADRLLDELAVVQAAFPFNGLPSAHRGELLLWMGRVDEAEADLERSLHIVRGTRWPYIGLGTAAILRGRPDHALVQLTRGVRAMNDTTGPAVFGVRGEAHYLLGHFGAAEADLRRAVRDRPTRLSSWLVLAMLLDARGDDDGARAAARATFTLAPGLLHDVQRARGSTEPTGMGELDRRTARGEALDIARILLRGNRSSSTLTYYTAEGRLRFGARAPDDPEAQRTTRLAYAGAVLDRGLDALGEPPTPSLLVRRASW